MSTLADAKLGQVSVNVKDVERATSFYRDKLGLPHLFSAAGMAFFKAGDVRLLLGKSPPEHAGPSSILYFKVDDVETAHRALTQAGVSFVREPHLVHDADSRELWLAFFEDGEGNTHALMEERATMI